MCSWSFYRQLSFFSNSDRGCVILSIGAVRAHDSFLSHASCCKETTCVLQPTKVREVHFQLHADQPSRILNYSVEAASCGTKQTWEKMNLLHRRALPSLQEAVLHWMKNRADDNAPFLKFELVFVGCLCCLLRHPPILQHSPTLRLLNLFQQPLERAESGLEARFSTCAVILRAEGKGSCCDSCQSLLRAPGIVSECIALIRACWEMANANTGLSRSQSTELELQVNSR